MEHEGCAPAEGPGQVGLEEGAGSGRAPSYTVRGVLNRPRSRWPSARSARVLWRSRWEKEHERMGVAPFACKVHAVLVASRHFWPYPTRGHRRQGLGVKAFPAPPPHLPAHPIECPRHPPWGSPTAPPPPCAGCAMSAVAIDEHAVGAGCTIAVFVCLSPKPQPLSPSPRPPPSSPTVQPTAGVGRDVAWGVLSPSAWSQCKCDPCVQWRRQDAAAAEVNLRVVFHVGWPATVWAGTLRPCATATSLSQAYDNSTCFGQRRDVVSNQGHTLYKLQQTQQLQHRNTYR